jgi:molybdopterin synthase sulfur carrier subunit
MSMVRVSVRFFASVREAAGLPECDLDASNLKQLIESMKSRFSPALARILDGRERDPDSVVILINGTNIGRAAAGAVRLSDGDEIAIFPPVSGG